MSKLATRAAILRHNFVNLYGDVIGFGVLFGTTLTYLSVYATHLGANTLELGLIASGPAIINLLISLPMVRWLEGKPLTGATFITSVAQRIGFVLLIALPWLFAQAESQVWAIIVITVVIAIPGTLLTVAFNSMFAEVVPANFRAEVVGRRNAYMSIAIMLTSFASGWLLDQLGFPGNYQIVFGVGAIGAAMSSFSLWRIRPVPATSETTSAPPRTPAVARSLIRRDLLQTGFGALVFTYLCFYISQNMNASINPLFWINDIHISDGEIGIGNALFYAAMTAGSFLLPRLIAKYGLRRVLVVSAFCYCAYPFILGLAWDVKFFYLASTASGFVWSITNGCLLNYLMDRVPANDRPAHMAWHNMALNLGITIGALMGAGLAEWVGNRQGLLVTGVFRLLSAAALMVWG